MRSFLFVIAVSTAACGPVAKGESIRSTVDVTPKTPPNLVGGYEFDLLDAVEGSACVTPADTSWKDATIPGFVATSGDVYMQRAEGGALFEAMTKAQGADTLLVTWVRHSQEDQKRCATVHARGVRLRQADAAAPAAAPAEPPATPGGPAPAPAAPGPAPAPGPAQ